MVLEQLEHGFSPEKIRCLRYQNLGFKPFGSTTRDVRNEYRLCRFVYKRQDQIMQKLGDYINQPNLRILQLNAWHLGLSQYMSDRMPDKMSEHMPDRMSEYVSHRV